VDLVNTLQELSLMKVGFVSLSEALDLTTPSGHALAAISAVLAEFERDKTFVCGTVVSAAYLPSRISGRRTP
jgi:DNA invertase Pin-like site-specific DNA recombinase